LTGKDFAQHRFWIVLITIGTIASCAWYFLASYLAQRLLSGSSGPGLAFGVVGGAIIFFEFLLWPRKALFRAWRIGSAQRWLRAHIWLGLFTVPLIVLHSGFRLGGLLPTALMILFTAVIVSGVTGLALQQFVPRIMLDAVSAETIYAQIQHVAEWHNRDAERLVRATCGKIEEDESADAPEDEAERTYLAVEATEKIGAWQGKVLLTSRLPIRFVNGSEPLRRAYLNEIRPFLLGGKRSHSVLRFAGPAAQFFDELRLKLPAPAHAVLDQIVELCGKRRQLDVQSRLHAVLHGWLFVHLPLSVLLVVLMVAHLVTALQYI